MACDCMDRAHFIHLPLAGHLCFSEFPVLMINAAMFEIYKRKIIATFKKLCVSVFQFVYVCAVAHIGQKRVSDPLVLELQAATLCGCWELNSCVEEQ